MQVVRPFFHEQQAGQNFALGVPLVQLVHGPVAVGGVVVQLELAQQQSRAVVLQHAADTAGLVFRGDLAARLNDFHAIHRFVVLANVVVALGGARVVVESDARADDIDEGRALMA